MGAPNAIRMRVDKLSDDFDFDPTAVTSAEFVAVKPNGSASNWVATLSEQTAAGVTATYTLDSADLSVDGLWRLWLKMFVPSGWIRTNSVQVIVRAENG